MIVFIDGKFVEEEKASVPISDRGFLFGDGVFTTIKIKEGSPEFFDEHLKQFLGQCEALKIHPPSIERADVEILIQKNKANKGVWRLKIIVTGGSSNSRGLERRSGRLIILLEPYQETTHVLKLSVFSGTIITPHSQLKTLSYLSRLYVAEEAKAKGVDDCIVTTQEGYLLETSMTNIFWVYQDELFTPAPTLPLLFGITLQHVIKQYPKVNFVKAALKEIPADAKFFCSSTLQGVRSAIIVP